MFKNEPERPFYFHQILRSASQRNFEVWFALQRERWFEVGTVNENEEEKDGNNKEDEMESDINIKERERAH